MLTCLPLSKEEEENLADILDLPKLERNQHSENRQETKDGLQLRKHSKRATEHQEEIWSQNHVKKHKSNVQSWLQTG